MVNGNGPGLPRARSSEQQSRSCTATLQKPSHNVPVRPRSYTFGRNCDEMTSKQPMVTNNDACAGGLLHLRLLSQGEQRSNGDDGG